MASGNKFQDFVEALGLAEHNLNTATFRVYLSNTTPSLSLDADKADLAEISGGNGYTALGEDITNTWSESAGTGTMAVADVVWTASGGAIAQFRYAVVYNDTHADNALMCHHDYGAAVDVADTETFTWDITTSIATIV